MGQRTQRADIRGFEPVDRHPHHVLRLFAVAGPPAVPDRKAEHPVSLISRLAPGIVAVHRPVRGGGGMTDPGSTVLGGGGMAEQDESAVLGGGGMAEQDESAVQGGGGITGPPRPKSRWDVSQVQLAGELSNSKSGGASSAALRPAGQAALAPMSILP
jgi:hypothetical protein